MKPVLALWERLRLKLEGPRTDPRFFPQDDRERVALSEAQTEIQLRRTKVISKFGPTAVVSPALLYWDLLEHRHILGVVALTVAYTVIAEPLGVLAASRAHRSGNIELTDRWLDIASTAGTAVHTVFYFLPPVDPDDAILTLVHYSMVLTALCFFATFPLRRTWTLGIWLVTTTACLGVALNGLPYAREFILLTLTSALLSPSLRGLVERHSNEQILLGFRLEESKAELASLNESLHHLATHDSLTGLGNRVKLNPELDSAVEDARAAGDQLAVMFLDVDRFKVVNDSLGHGSGDALLKVVADRSKSVLPARAILARPGGDEFVFVLPETSKEGAVRVAEELRAEIAKPIDLDGRRIVVTASIGLAISQPADSSEDLMRQADAALYRAKDLGRDRVAVFDQRLGNELSERFDEEQSLRRAIEAGEIEPWFQPEFDLFTGDIIGATALARYHHPTRGVLEAGSFLALAEELGILEPLSDAITAKALTQRAEWTRRGLPEPFAIRIHVDPHQLTLTDFARRMHDRLARYDCDPKSVVVEVTASELITDIARTNAQLMALREMGIRVCLDDFGKGYSSFSRLVGLPIDAVKIDRSLVRDSASPKVRAAIGSLAVLAHKLGIQLSADGVESPEQAQYLREVGCRSAQGYLWSGALTPEALRSMTEASSSGEGRGPLMWALNGG